MNERKRLALKAILLAAGALFFWYVRAVLVPFVFATVIAYMLEPAVEYLCSKKVPRAYAILAVYLLVGGIVAGLICFVVPGFIAEVNKLTEVLPSYGERLRTMAYTAYSSYRGADIPDSLRLAIDESLVEFQSMLLGLTRNLVQRLMEAVSWLLALAISPVLAYYMLSDLPKLRQRAFAFTQDKDWASLLSSIDGIIRGFVRGQVLVGLFVGASVFLVLSAFGVSFPLLLGVLAGLGELIPYFGPLMAAVPAVVLALSKSMLTAVEVAAVLVAIQQLDSAVIYPRIVGNGVGLHPLGVVFAVLAGGYLGGIWGMFLAVPVAAVLREVVKFIWLKYLSS
ncbi:MAG: AI-2E family transporter [Bacillota bacterium]